MPAPGPEDLARALQVLRRGEVIVFPTETLYGLGADALNPTAVERVYALKDRDPRNPIPILIADRAMLETIVSEIPPNAQKLMHRFWPGPLTLVLPARRGLPEPLLNPNGGVGVRISSQAFATDLTRALGRPLTATSANPSGQSPARSIEQAKRYFAGRVELFVDAGPLTSRIGSTVVELLDGDLNVLREGEITRSELETCLSS